MSTQGNWISLLFATAYVAGDLDSIKSISRKGVCLSALDVPMEMGTELMTRKR